MRLYKTKWFGRVARKHGISDASLREAIERAQKGLIGADLGGQLIKQRVAREGQGRRGGLRMIAAFDANAHAIFLLAFAKNERDNITPKELASLKRIAALWLGDEKKIDRDVKEGELLEVKDGDEEKT